MRFLEEHTTRLFSALFGDGNWCVWWNRAEDGFIFNENVEFIQTMEQRVLLRKFITGLGKQATVEPNHPFCSQLIPGKPCAYSYFEDNGNQVILVVVQTKQHLLSAAAIQLLADLKQQQVRSTVGKIIRIKEQAISEYKKKEFELIEILNSRTNELVEFIIQKHAFPVTVSLELINSWNKNLYSAQQIIQIIKDFLLTQQFLFPEETHFQMSETDVLPDSVTTKSERLQPSSFERTFLLLDKYEAAAQKLYNANSDINGKTIAYSLSPVISPPAVSDALKKNKKVIESLLLENPTKWMLIRTNLKPLIQIQERISFSH